MELAEEHGLFFLNEFSYTKEEVEAAREIRDEKDETRKQFLSKCFEVETGKLFPKSDPIEVTAFGLDISAALFDSSQTERHMSLVLGNARLSRTHFPLD